jgi:aromatic ring hydroxylase
MLANVCKHHVTKMPFEMGRIAQDLAGGLVSTAPSEKELKHPELGALLDKYLKGRADVPTESRIRILRQVSQGPRRRADRIAHSYPAIDREHDDGPQRGWLSD